MDLRKSDVIIDGGLVVKKNKTDRRSRYLYALVLALVAVMPLSAFAQGSIFGTVQNSDLSTPANGDISFVGFLDDTDEEIRIESSIGAGYDAGNWLDDFQNYLTEAPGNPYDYYFYNLANDEGFHLGKPIPNNSFQQEDILLAAVAWPFKPTGMTGTPVSIGSVVVGWNSTPGMTYHVYRRVATSGGSFFRVDDPTGSLANAGVSDSFFVDVTVDGVSSYDYLIMAEDASGNYSEHSDVITVNSSALTAPVVVAISPDSGLTLGGTLVTITGSGFDIAGAGALVGASSLTGVTVVSPFEITGSTQTGVGGLADVSVTNLASGQVSNILVGGFNYVSNSLPVLAAIGPQSVTEGQLLSTIITATDADGGFPIMTSSALPTGATYVDNGDGTGSLDWTPGFFDDGVYNVTFYATDDLQPSLVDSEQVVITVNEAGNQLPVLAALGPQGGTENSLLNFAVTATDIESTPVLTTSTLPTGATFVDNGDGSGAFDWLPGFTDAGTYNVSFYATDDSLAIDSELVVITINEVGNQTPVLAAIGAQGTTENVNLNFGINASDPDATIPALTTSALPTGATFVDNGDGSGTFDWTPGFVDAGTYNVTFYASDGPAADSEAVVITVTESGNQSPVLAAIGAQNTTENINLNFGVTASDPDATIPALTTSTLPTGATFFDNGDGSGTFDWLPGFTDAGTYNVTFYASDGSAADSEAVVITVGESGNQDPVLAAIGAQSTTENINLNFGVTASDPDATIPTLSTSALPTGATFVDNGDGSGTFDWTPGFTDAGTYNVTFYASDGPAADSEAVVITINESGNQDPVLAAIGPQGTNEDINLTFGVSAFDPDATIPALSTSALPTGATFVDNGDGSGTFDWTPGFTDAGIYNVTFYASDGPAADSEAVVITVAESGNQSPLLVAIGAQIGTENINLTFGVTATDPDATIPTLSTSTLPIGATFVDNGDGTGTFDWTPGFTDAGLYNVTFYADDGALTDSEAVAITVNEAGNQDPVLAAIGAQGTTENVNLTFGVTATDPDATIPTLTTSLLPTGATFVDNGDGSGTFDWTPDFTQSGTHIITFYAGDGLAADSEAVTILVNEIGNQAPVLAAVGPQTIAEGANLNFVVTASDPDGTIPLMSNSALPTGATYIDNGDGTATFDWTPDFTQNGVYDVTFFADDGMVADSEAVTITVNDAGSQMPNLTAIGPQTVVEGLNLNLIITASDPDATIPTLATSTLPTGATFVDNGDGTGVFDWTPDFTQANVYNVTFYADDGALIDSEQVVITVTESANHAAVLDSIGARSAFEGILLNVLVTASDTDGTIPALSAGSLPTGAIFTDYADGSGLLEWTPDFLSAGVYNVVFYADDGVALADSEWVEITVTESGDQPPVIAIIPDTSVAEGQTLEVVITASDPEGGFISIAANTVMDHIAFVDSGNGVAVLTYTPDYFDAGVDTVRIFASEIAPPYQSSLETFVITTLEANQPPVFDSIGPFTVAVEDSLTFLVSATDTSDGDAAGTIFLTMLTSPPNSTFIDNGDNTGRFTFHPDHGMEGIDTATFLAVDQGTPGLSTTMAVEITVVGSNIPPVLDPIGPQSVDEGGTLVVNVTASDPDGGLSVMLSVDSLLENATFVDNLDNTGVFTFNPGFLQAGLYSVTFLADDGQDAAEELVLIQVNEAGNQAPVFDPLLSLAVIEGDTLVGSITAQDPELEAVSYLIDSLTMPANFTFEDSGNGVAWFSFTPDFTQAGLYDITVLATDGSDTTQGILTIDVLEAGNQFPVLSQLFNVTVDETNLATFVVAALDIDGPPPILTSTALPGTATFEDLDGDNIYDFNWTPSYDDSGSYSVWFYATDADFPSDVDSAEVIITVVDVNRVPWLLIPFGQPDSVMELDTLVFTVWAWDDDGSLPDVQVDIGASDGLLPNMIFDVTWDAVNEYQVGVLTFVPDYSQGGTPPAQVYMKFHVFDEFDASLEDSTGTQTIHVYDRNQAPTIVFSDGVGPFNITEGENVNFNVQASDDRDLPSLRVEGLPDSNYTASQPSQDVILFSFSPDFTQVGQYFLTFIADDLENMSDTQIVEINVAEAGNQPPVWSVILADTIDVFVNYPWMQTLSATDPELSSVTMEATPPLSNAIWDTAGGVLTYIFTPDFTQANQVFEVSFIATDLSGQTTTMVTNLNVASALRGDLDGNERYTLNDIVMLSGYIFRGSSEPNPMDVGDADMSGMVDVADIVYMINFLYHAGPRPPQ